MMSNCYALCLPSLVLIARRVRTTDRHAHKDRDATDHSTHSMADAGLITSDTELKRKASKHVGVYW